ncbi:hypothetical protein [Fusibacter ferrireducens]|nr:hypothetical protein [Fusibacter ferrireducens]
MPIPPYSYEVAVVGDTIYFVESTSTKAYTPSAEPIPQEITLQAEAGDSKVSLSWIATTTASAYNVKRSTTAGGPYTVIDTSETTSYVDLTATNGVTYYYVVSSMGNDDVETNSNEVMATPMGSSNPNTFQGNRAILMLRIDGLEKEYDMPIDEIYSFINWYEAKSGSVANTKPFYIIDKNYNVSPFLNRFDYINFDHLQYFEVKDYNQ